jgi:hypothetical protein
MADAGPDDLPSAPPGTDQDAGSDNTIAATVEAAKAAGMAHVMEIEQATHTAGDSIGDVMPLPSKPFWDQNQPMQAEPPPNAGPSSPSGH